MRIRRLRLQHFRGIESCTVDVLPDEADCGVTVIEGPNEVGKTSIADALRLVFDHQHTSRRREIRALQPAGRDVATTVTVDFDHGDVRVSYTKRWNRDPAAQLSVRGPRNQDLAGKEAHARALELLGDMVDVELWRSLHVGQGQVVQPDIAGASALLAALDADGAPVPVVGQPGAASGPGPGGAADERDAAVLAHVQRELARWRTPAGRDRRPLTDVTGRRDALREELIAAQHTVDVVASDLEEIAALRSAIPEQQAQLTRARTELAELTRRSDRLQAQQAALERCDEVVAAARARAQAADQAWERRQELAADAEAARIRAQPSEQDEAEILEDAGTRLRSASAVLERAEREVARHRDALGAAHRHHERLGDIRRLAALRGRRHRLAALDDRIADLAAQVAAAPVDDAALDRLRALQATLSEARAARAGGEAAVQITALTDTAVRIADGSPRALAEGETTRVDVDGTRSVTLGAVARLELLPGPTQRDLSAAVAAAGDDLDRALAGCGVGDIAQAEVAHAGRAEQLRAHREAVAERTALSDLDSHRDLDSRIEELTRRLAGASDRPGAPVAPRAAPGRDDPIPTERDVDAAAQDVRRLEDHLHEAEARHRDAVADRERARRAHDDLRARREQQRIAQEVGRQSLAAAEERLAAQRAVVDDAALERQREDRRLALETARAARADAAQAVAGEEPAALAEHCAATQAAVAAGSQRLAEDERRLAALEAAVAARSDEGPVSRRDAVRRNLDRASAELARLERRADAAQLALDVLERHRTERRRRYLSPLRQQIEHLGRILWGTGFSVELDDDLQIRTRVLAGQALDYERLSLGAREQLSLISRLACAIVVGPAGAPIVVDDALGFSDPERLRRMGAVLSVAGRSTQLLLLTCHPQRYGHVAGARTVRLRGSAPGRSDPAAA